MKNLIKLSSSLATIFALGAGSMFAHGEAGKDLCVTTYFLKKQVN